MPQVNRRSGSLRPEFLHQIALGMHAPYGLVTKFGSNLNVGTTAEVVWPPGGTSIPFFPTTAATLDIVSTSTFDDTGGIGMTEVEVQGLDANLNPLQEVVTLDGTNAVTTTGEFYRVYRMFGTAVTADFLTNVGDITATHNGSGLVIAHIEASQGQTQQAHFTIPAGCIGILIDLAMSSSSSSDGVTYQLWQRQSADAPLVAGVNQPRRLVDRYDDSTGFTRKEYAGAVVFSEKTDIWMTATKIGGGPAPQANVSFDILIAPDVGWSQTVF